jgi:transcription initiation factor IIF auxiliary subunit
MGEAIHVTIEIGHKAWNLTNKIEDYTHKWNIFVRSGEPDKQYFDKLVQKVVFNLHSTFANPIRVLSTPPFCIKENGYGEFDLPVDIYFHGSSEKYSLTYFLQLPPLNTSAPMSMLRREIITFLNPSAEFRRILIDGGASVEKLSAKNSLITNSKQQQQQQPSMGALAKKQLSLGNSNSPLSAHINALSPKNLAPDHCSIPPPPPPPPSSNNKSIHNKNSQVLNNINNNNQLVISSSNGHLKANNVSTASGMTGKLANMNSLSNGNVNALTEKKTTSKKSLIRNELPTSQPNTKNSNNTSEHSSQLLQNGVKAKQAANLHNEVDTNIQIKNHNTIHQSNNNNSKSQSPLTHNPDSYNIIAKTKTTQQQHQKSSKLHPKNSTLTSPYDDIDPSSWQSTSNTDETNQKYSPPFLSDLKLEEYQNIKNDLTESKLLKPAPPPSQPAKSLAASVGKKRPLNTAVEAITTPEYLCTLIKTNPTTTTTTTTNKSDPSNSKRFKQVVESSYSPTPNSRTPTPTATSLMPPKNQENVERPISAISNGSSTSSHKPLKKSKTSTNLKNGCVFIAMLRV